MARETITVGAPFLGMQDYPDERGIQAVNVSNFWINEGRLVSTPQRRTLDATRYCQRGIYVSGVQNNAVIVTLGEDANGHIIYRASRDVFAVEVDLTDYYAELPTRDEPYWFATLGRSIYFGCGQQVFKVNGDTLNCAPMTLSPGREAQTVAYLTSGSVPARVGTVYQGRMWYALAETKDFSTSIQIDPNDPLIKNPETLVTTGIVRYTPSQILFSDPYEPDSIQWYAAYDIDDVGAEVTGLVPWQSAMLILTTKGLWLLEGDSPSNWGLRQINQYADCVAPRSIVATNDAVVWWGANAIWRLSGEGLASYSGLDWLFNIQPNTLASVSRLLGIDMASTWRGKLQLERVSGAPWNSGTHAIFAAGTWNTDRFKGSLRDTLILEIATGSVSIFHDDPVVCVCGADTSRVLGNAGGVLVSNPNDVYGLQAFSLGDAPTSGANHTYIMRLAGDGSLRRNGTRQMLRMTSMPLSVTVAAIPIDEAVRATASGTTTPPAFYQAYAEQITTPLGGNLEGSVWAVAGDTEPKWVGTPTAGQVRPRFSHGTPVIYETGVQAVGRDIGTGFLLRPGDAPLAIEGFTLEFETETAP